MGIIGSVWRGEASLAGAYWGWGVVIGSLMTIVALAISVASESIAAAVGMATFLSFYCAWTTVGIWRSAVTYRGPRLWAVLARIASVAVMLLFAWTLIHLLNS